MTDLENTQQICKSISWYFTVAALLIGVVSFMLTATTKQLSCKLQFVTCPNFVLDAVRQQLTNSSLFISQPTQKLQEVGLEITEIRRFYPTQLDLEVRITENGLTNQAETGTTTSLASSLLIQHGVEHLAVTQSNDYLLVQLTEQRRAILDPFALELSVKRLELIVKYFDFTTIPEEVVEIDARFKLPVLRNITSSEIT